jgi:hypothetical protein
MRLTQYRDIFNLVIPSEVRDLLFDARMKQQIPRSRIGRSE